MKASWLLTTGLVCLLSWNAGAAEESLPSRFALWDAGQPFPDRQELSYPQGAVDVVVHRAGSDAYQFLHDAAIVAHGGTLWAAWYNCPRGEMIGQSLIRGRRSLDGGRTWSDVEVIASDRTNQGILYVPVAFLSFQGKLYAFVTQMKGGPDLVYDCEIFLWKEQTQAWASQGLLAAPFLPNCAPQPLADGNFVMAGRLAEAPGQQPTIPAVAISRGEEVAAPWNLVRLLPSGTLPDGQRLPCPETTVVVDGVELTALVRREQANSLLFFSYDQGRSWSEPCEHNLAMEASKIYAGRLSTGQRYVVCNLAGGPRRALLGIAVSRPGETTLVKAWKIRDGYSAALQAGPEWSYPCALEFDGKLGIVYTSEKHHCVLTTIPLTSLAVEVPARDARSPQR